MVYTKGERYVACSDEWWFTEIANPNLKEPNFVVGRFWTKGDALLDAVAPKMYEALGTIKRTAESSGGDIYYLQNALKIISRIVKETLAECKS